MMEKFQHIDRLNAFLERKNQLLIKLQKNGFLTNLSTIALLNLRIKINQSMKGTLSSNKGGGLVLEELQSQTYVLIYSGLKIMIIFSQHLRD